MTTCLRPLICLAVATLPAQGLLSGEPPTLVPPPRQVNWSRERPASLVPGEVAIVLGNHATDPEQQAARLLQETVAKRFDHQWPILPEANEAGTHTTLVILGQRSTCRRLDELCRRRGIALSDSAPGQDGYTIDMVQEGDRLLVLVGGYNARGVEYGQDTLSQMLRGSGASLALVRGSVRDAPVIPWRGRPQTSVAHYLRPGEMDLYVLSRVNFIDLRGGIYAFEPGEKLDHPQIVEALKQAHLRGILVYGTVNCGVPARDYAKVLGTFQEMLELGADGLWLSFDDKGPGEDPVTLVTQVLALGRTRQMPGHLIAITPPKGSYQKITTDFNRKIMAVPGMESALWFWTGVPSTAALAETRALGLKVKPGWWHNWPRLATPQAYAGLPALSLGWSAPDYDLLAAGGDCLEAVMPWGGNAFGQHYIVPVIDWWGWNPTAHDWPALRRRIYGLIFGQAQAAAAFKFDDDLHRLFGLFQYSYKNSDELPLCPPRLRQAATRPQARALLASMTSGLDSLTSASPKQTLLPPAQLESAYLTPMRKELETHRAALDLEYPEEWWPAHQRLVLEALYMGDTARVDQLAAEARPRLSSQLDRITKGLSSYPESKAYANWWRQRASLDAKGWKELTVARHQALAERVREYSRQILNAGTMLEGLRSPPLEWGIGRWQVGNRLLATVLPSANEQFWGDWMAGLHRQKDLEAAVFAADRKTPGTIGEYAELPVTVPLAGRRDRLGLLLFVSSTNKDLFSNTLVKYRWAGYRFLELLWQDKVLWEADLGRIPDRGDWFLVRLPPIPDDPRVLSLRLRVEDRKLSMNNYTITFVGPLRLLELPD